MIQNSELSAGREFSVVFISLMSTTLTEIKPLECLALFYRSLIGDEASVIVTILDMNALALKMFFNSLNCHASKLLEKVGAFHGVCKILTQPKPLL